MKHGFPDRQASTVVVAMLLSLAPLGLACSGLKRPPVSPVPCSRVPLDPPPPWTAAATWDPSGNHLILVDPGSKTLVAYTREGQRTATADLADSSLDFSRPMRLESTDSGYTLLSQTVLVELDASLRVTNQRSPFENLDKASVESASVNDALLRKGELVGHFDLIDNATLHEGGTGSLRSGFGRIDLATGHWELTQELPLENNGEYATYYLYDRRPYVTRSGRKIYVLRFSVPWTISRFSRSSLIPIAQGNGTGEDYVHSLHSWRGRLYLLSSILLNEETSPDEAPEVVEQPSEQASRASIEIRQAIPSLAGGERRWELSEIDPSSGEILRRIELPTRAERIRLVPGPAFWTAVEESAGVDLGDEADRTSLLFLPGSEIVSGRFGCVFSGDGNP